MICRRARVECSAKKQGLKSENGRAEWRARERAARPHTQRGGLLLMMMLLPLMMISDARHHRRIDDAGLRGVRVFLGVITRFVQKKKQKSCCEPEST